MKRKIQPVRFISLGALRVIGLRRRYPKLQALRWIAKQWDDFNTALRELELPESGVAYGVCLEGDCADEIQYLAGIEADSTSPLPSQFSEVVLSPQQYAVFAHSGPASTIPQTWSRIRSSWLPLSSYRAAAAPDLERYGPGFDPVSCSGDIEIWVPVRLRRVRPDARNEAVRHRTI
jgi:AraC family transcriptional regulator